jgi:hypothetical protein
MTLFKRTLILGIVFYALVASATNQGFQGTVLNIRNGWGAEGFYFDLNPAANNGCQYSSSFVIQSSRTDINQMVALVMTAHSTGEAVGVETNGTCSSGAAVVIGINLP